MPCLFSVYPEFSYQAVKQDPTNNLCMTITEPLYMTTPYRAHLGTPVESSPKTLNPKPNVVLAKGSRSRASLGRWVADMPCSQAAMDLSRSRSFTGSLKRSIPEVYLGFKNYKATILLQTLGVYSLGLHRPLQHRV